ncbi:MAG: DNA translocase FtsK 4TM domain-containing protein [Candidatus Sumerlaeaceae bacterium]
MYQAPSTRTARAAQGGFRDELLNEAIAVALMLTGLLLLLSLASQGHGGSNLVGRLGGVVSSGLTFTLGEYVSYLIPLLVLGGGAAVWRRQDVPRGPLRVLGLLFAAICMCAIIAVPYAATDFTKKDGFRAGGAIGNFLMHRECLNLAGYLGRAGAYLLFGGALILSVSILTDIRIRSTTAATLRWVRTWKPKTWKQRLSAWFEVIKEAFESDEPGDVQPTARVEEPESRRSFFRWGGRSAQEEEPSATVGTRAQSLSAPPLQTTRGATSPAAAVVDVAEIAQKRYAALAASVSSRQAPKAEVDDLVTMAETEAVQEELPLVRAYETPGLDLLNPAVKVKSRMSQQEMDERSGTLERTLGEFGISATVVQVTQGPTVTRFEVQPAPGVKVARIAALENDIAMCMKAESVRIIAPVPGKGTVGLEIPNHKATPVYLREMLETEAFRNHPSPLAFALGKTISGEPYICDLAAMPHLLIAGTTGSGKSVCLNSVICSILFRMQPEKVKMVMVDPKRVELNVYQAIPHLLAPVVCEPRKAAAALNWAIEEMEERYKKLASLGVRNIDGYNAIVKSKQPHPKAVGRHVEYMPHIVIIIDELADLMIIAKNEVEDSIIRLAQMSRAVGMHLILATQRPSVNVITGIIKANFPSRVAFQVSSKVDSRTILDTNGAESLLGRGDMLFSPGGSPKPIRLQGCYLSDQEVERTADWVRSQARANYVKTDFLTQHEIEEQRLKASQEMGRRGDDELRMNGIDADDSSVAVDDDGDDYDYSYQQQRKDGRDLRQVLGAGGSTSRTSNEDSDAIDDELFRQAAKLILVHRKASVSLLQRKLKIGFARAGRVMDMLEEAHIVGPNVGSKVRDIIVDPDEYLAQMEDEGEEKF